MKQAGLSQPSLTRFFKPNASQSSSSSSLSSQQSSGGSQHASQNSNGRRNNNGASSKPISRPTSQQEAIDLSDDDEQEEIEDFSDADERPAQQQQRRQQQSRADGSSRSARTPLPSQLPMAPILLDEERCDGQGKMIDEGEEWPPAWPQAAHAAGVPTQPPQPQSAAFATAENGGNSQSFSQNYADLQYPGDGYDGFGIGWAPEDDDDGCEEPAWARSGSDTEPGPSNDHLNNVMMTVGTGEHAEAGEEEPPEEIFARYNIREAAAAREAKIEEAVLSTDPSLNKMSFVLEQRLGPTPGDRL